MSQKSAKRVRKLEERVEALEFNERIACLEDGYIKTVQEDRDAALRRAERAEQDAIRWKSAAVGALLAAIVVEIIVICVNAKAVEPTPDDGQAVLTVEEVLAEPSAEENEPQSEISENQLIELALLAKATRLDDVTVTHYDVCVACCGKADGVTASGVQATPGVTVAVDPAVIPLGSDVLVDYGDGDIQYYRADDTGKGVVGNAIDLCVASHAEALELGRRTATVYFVPPEC